MVFNSLNEFSIYNDTKEDLTKEISYIKKILKHALKYEKIKNAEFNVILVTNKKTKEINKEYRKIDKKTDVISFTLENKKEAFKLEKRLLGDIYISVDKAKTQAKEYNHSNIRELC